MKILFIHADFIEYEARKKAIKSAEEVPKGKEKDRMEECLVAFTAVEKVDEANPCGAAKKAFEEIKKISSQVQAKNIMLYPYAHLSPDLSKPEQAVEVMKETEKLLKEAKYNVKRAPFGWYKSFNIACKGHPLSELSSSLIPDAKEGEEGKEGSEGGAKACEVVSEALKAEEKLKSYWYIMDEDGKLHDVSEFNFSKYPKLKKFAFYEKQKDRTSACEPLHIALMKKLELVDYEPASDCGNMRYYPKGRLIKKLLEEYVTDKVVAYGGVELETPVMYDMKHPTLEKYLHKFPARQYQITSDKKNFFLRFAACFGQFLIAHDAVISYKHLPLKLYELTRYSFRREQRGELCGVRRLRAFTMPDVHALCSDLEQAKEEYKIRFQLCMDVLKGCGIEPKDYEMGLRVTKEFYEQNKPLIVGLAKKLGKPILVEMWDERKFYFILKYELNYVDSVDKAAALSTDQIDVENGERYDMSFTDKDGKKKYPVVLHCSPSGAIERVIYTLLELQGEKIQKGQVPEFPLWLCPTQVRLIPVSPEKHLEKCNELAKEIFGERIRIDIDDNTESIGKRVRQAEKEWVPYILVVGDEELKADKFKARVRGKKDAVEMGKHELIKEIKEKTKEFPWKPLPLPMLLSKRPQFQTMN
ncbi:threonine--tRNA ligase [Candidatus Woesearchaeota archaeon]|nr:threonine--tRNA ligase [Candidatus Woesearchaeota archaeon]